MLSLLEYFHLGLPLSSRLRDTGRARVKSYDFSYHLFCWCDSSTYRLFYYSSPITINHSEIPRCLIYTPYLSCRSGRGSSCLGDANRRSYWGCIWSGRWCSWSRSWSSSICFKVERFDPEICKKSCLEFISYRLILFEDDFECST